MKILKYLLIALVGLILLFILIGMIKPTVSYGHEITTHKPVQEAWAVSQDEGKMGQWLEGFKSIELISGEQGEVGSKYRVIVNPEEGQPDFEMIETIVSVKENDHIELHFDSDMMIFEQRLTFSKSNGKTNVKTESKVSGKGIMMKSMFAIMEIFTGSFQSQEELHIENLKKVIDRNSTIY